MDALIEEIVNSVAGTEVSVDEQQVKSVFQEIAPNLLVFCFRIGVSILLLLIGKKLIRWTQKVVEHGLMHYHVNETIRTIANTIIKIIGYAIFFLYIAKIFRLPLGPIFTIIGSIAIGVIIALKDYLANLAGGVLLLGLMPFRFGDYIIDQDGHEGTVQRVGMLYTILITLDGKTIFVPNSLLTKECVINVTREGKRRIELEVAVSYNTDLKKAKRVMQRVIEQENHLEDPPIQVFIGDLEDSAIIVKAFFWTTVDDYWPVLRDIKEKVKDAYDKEGILVPFPQLDIRFSNQVLKSDINLPENIKKSFQ